MSAPLQIGNTVLHYKQTASTNDLAKQLIQHHSVPNGTVVVTAYQSQGRGQQNKGWESESGKNLLCTFIINERDLYFQHQIFFNMAVCCAVRKCIANLVPAHTVNIKWPNDMYVNKKKIAGILIENMVVGETWKNSMLGIGINVNQIHFAHESATSIQLLNETNTDVNDVLSALSKQLTEYLTAMNDGSKETILAEYNAHLLQIGETSRYIANGLEKEAKLLGIDQHGRAMMESNNHVETFQHGEIKLIIS